MERWKKMKENIKKQFEQFLHNATAEDLETFQYVLDGFQHKQRSYIGSILHFDGKMKGDTYELTIPLNALVNNPLNILHGGITATVIDSAMGALCHHMLPDGFAAVTTQINIHYIAPGIGDAIHCTVKIDHHGTKTLVLSAEVYRTDGKKIAQATSSFFIIKK